MGHVLSGPMTSLYFLIRFLFGDEARNYLSRILHLGLGCQNHVPSGSCRHGRLRSMSLRSCSSTQLGCTPWSFGIMSSHMRPFAPSVCASMQSVPVFFLRQSVFFSVLDFVVPQLYFCDVSVEGGFDLLVVVPPAGRVFGFPRIAMMMVSSLLAIPCLIL